VQLAKLSVNNDSRQRLTAFYREKLKETDISIPFSKIDLKDSSCHILPVLLPEAVDRLKVIASLKEKQIQSSIHYPAFIDFTAYKDIKGRAPVAESICARELTLPLYPSMREEQVDLVCEALLEAIKQT
jgi:dTDP-4-amino-4,6-dideoxygalactose transaminase